MPEGQFSGQRAAYEYVADDGTTYLLTLDETLGGIGATGLTAASSGSTAATKPDRFTPRVVFWQGTLSGRTVRKELVCNADGSIYTNNSQSLTIDGVAGSTTGRRGEKLTFVRLPTA